MKAVLTVIAVSIAASLLASTSRSAEAGTYSSKASLISQRSEAAPSVTVACTTQEPSSRYALLASHPGTTTEAPRVEVASYNSKTTARGEHRVETIELAPLK